MALVQAMNVARNRFNTAKKEAAENPNAPPAGEEGESLTAELGQTIQANAAKMYAGELAEALREQTEAGKDFASVIRQSRRDVVLSEAQAQRMQAALTSGQGLPDGARAQLLRSGISPAQRRQALRQVFKEIDAQRGGGELRLSNLVSSAFPTKALRAYHESLQMVDVAVLTTALARQDEISRRLGLDLNTDLQQAELACSIKDRNAMLRRFADRAMQARGIEGRMLRDAARTLVPYEAPQVNIPPTAVFNVYENVPAHTMFITALSSTDPDGRIQKLCVRWDFGDGTTGSGLSNNHTFPAAGTYNVTLEIIDNAFAPAKLTKAVTVP